MYSLVNFHKVNNSYNRHPDQEMKTLLYPETFPPPGPLPVTISLPKGKYYFDIHIHQLIFLFLNFM